MARKRKKRDYSEEEEWSDWGEKFGKRMERRGKDFGEEMSDWGERFSKRMNRRWRYWWFDTFGFVGPLLGSIIGIIFVAIGIFILNFINLFLASSFISAVSSFLFENLNIFFAIFIFTGYNDYFSKRYRRSYWMISPITAGIGAVIAFWIIAWAIVLINTVPKFAILTTISNFLFANFLGIFLLVLVFGYVVVAIKKLIIDEMGY